MSNPGNTNTRWWLPPALALLPTGGLAWTEIEVLRDHPLLAVVVAIVWVGTAWIFGLFGALLDRWRPGVLDWCDARVLAVVRRSERHYREWVGYRNRDFDVKGLSTQGQFSLDLASVFVDLRLVPKPIHQSPSNPIALPQDTGTNAPAELDFGEAIRRHGLVAILGAPGSGKTTLLRHAALTLVGPRSMREANGLPKATPVLLFLREVSSLIEEEEAGLVEAIATGSRGCKVDRAWIQRELEGRRCLIMLDGLDEVADPAARAAIVRWIEDQISTFPGNRWVVTARPFGYQSNPIAGFNTLSVQPLRRHQIADFLDNWYAANEVKAAQREDDGVLMRAEEGASDLLARIDRSPDLVRLAVNPLLLTLIANVHRWRSSLPGRRVELYIEICDVFLGKRQEARGISSALTPAQKKLVLQVLAWNLMSTRRRELPEAEAATIVAEALERVSPGADPGAFFRMVEAGSGLLLERESGVWGFAHKTFQEFLAAVHAHERRLAETLVGHVADDWWHETIRLYAALGDASEIIASCMLCDPPVLPALVLAIQCADEAREVDPQVRTNLIRLVDQQLDSQDPDHRRLAAECRLEMRLRAMDRIDDAVFADPELVSNAEYQLFVMAEAEAGHSRQPDHWQGKEFPHEKSRAPALGVRGVDAIAFCAWLTNRDGGDWVYRLPNHHEFMLLDDQQVPQGAGYWYTDPGSSLGVFSHGVTDDMDVLTSRFEQVVVEDLRRIAALPAEARARLGLNISDRDVQLLVALAAWADAGGIRVAERILTNAIDVWPTTVWWRTAHFFLSGVGFLLRGPSTLARLLLRGWVWTLSRVGGDTPAIARERVAQTVGRAAGRVAQGVAHVAVWLVDPIVWIAGPLVRRLFKEEVEELEQLPPAASGAPEPWSPSALAKVIEGSGDDDAQIRSVASLVLLVITQIAGRILLQSKHQLPARGTAILTLCRRSDIPAPLAKLARALAERDWEGELDGSAAADLSWATRISLLLWWRHGFAESFIALAQRRGHFPKLPSEDIELGVLDAWFDAWAIGERSAGTTLPFEGIRIVKERRHAD